MSAKSSGRTVGTGLVAFGVAERVSDDVNVPVGAVVFVRVGVGVDVRDNVGVVVALGFVVGSRTGVLVTAGNAGRAKCVGVGDCSG